MLLRAFRSRRRCLPKSPSAAPRRTPRPVVEALEERCVPSATMVSRFQTDPFGPDFSGATAYNNALYFVTGGLSQGLYKSDGTAGGTTLVKALPPDSGGVGGNRDFTVANGLLFFADGGELWKSDGTWGGTTVIKNSVLGNYGPHSQSNLLPQSFPVINGSIYFVSAPDTPSASPTLWKTDGTAAGTVEVNLGLSPPAGETLQYLRPDRDQRRALLRCLFQRGRGERCDVQDGWHRRRHGSGSG